MSNTFNPPIEAVYNIKEEFDTQLNCTNEYVQILAVLEDKSFLCRNMTTDLLFWTSFQFLKII